MKIRVFIITKYILREHTGPFLFGLLTIIFVFLLNIVFRDLGRLLGKGLPAEIIAEFFIFNLAWIIALAIPMSVLVATLMAFGRLSSDNEITALKASGVNLYRLITPVLVAAGFLSIGMVQFNNQILPDFNHRVRLLYSDISRKRPTLTLEPNVFFNEIPNYSILVHGIKEKKNLLSGIIINDTSDPKYSKTIIAEKGNLTFSDEQEKMVLTLFNGEVHEVDTESFENYRRLKFQQQILSISVPNMVLKRSQSQHRGDREKSASMMKDDIKGILKNISIREDRIREIVRTDMAGLFPEELWMGDISIIENRKNLLFKQTEAETKNKVERLIRQIQGEVRIISGFKRAISALNVEIQKKYSIPVACIVFVLIGAPLGIMVRQGGMAIGGGLSIIFFLIYWAFLIGGEQLADRQIIGHIIAMWSPNVVVGAGGIYLVIRTVREVTFIPWERWKEWFQNIRSGRKQ